MESKKFFLSWLTRMVPEKKLNKKHKNPTSWGEFSIAHRKCAQVVQGHPGEMLVAKRPSGVICETHFIHPKAMVALRPLAHGHQKTILSDEDIRVLAHVFCQAFRAGALAHGPGDEGNIGYTKQKEAMASGSPPMKYPGPMAFWLGGFSASERTIRRDPYYLPRWLSIWCKITVREVWMQNMCSPCYKLLQCAHPPFKLVKYAAATRVLPKLTKLFY